MKIFHISDLHFGFHNLKIIKSFLHTAQELRPNIILISGDITHRAKSEQFKQFCHFIEKIGITTLTVPGNHDIPLFNFIKRLMSPFENYQKYVNPEMEISYQDEVINILGLNTVNIFHSKQGKITQSQLDKIQNFFKGEVNKFNLLFFHHNFDEFEGLHKPLTNYQKLIEYVELLPINVICTGHLHFAKLSLIEKLDKRACILLHAGSAFCIRKKDHYNSFYEITIEDKKTKFTLLEFKKNKFVKGEEEIYDLNHPYAELYPKPPVIN